MFLASRQVQHDCLSTLAHPQASASAVCVALMNSVDTYLLPLLLMTAKVKVESSSKVNFQTLLFRIRQNYLLKSEIRHNVIAPVKQHALLDLGLRVRRAL